jgi:hypothetical protein
MAYSYMCCECPDCHASLILHSVPQTGQAGTFVPVEWVHCPHCDKSFGDDQFKNPHVREFDKPQKLSR